MIAWMIWGLAHAGGGTLAYSVAGMPTTVDEESRLPVEYRAELDGWAVSLSARSAPGGVAVAARLHQISGKRATVRDHGELVLEPGVVGEISLSHKRAPLQLGFTLEWAQTFEPSVRDENEPVSKHRYALVWDDAELRSHPHGGDVEVERTLPGRTDPSSQVSPFKLVAEWGSTHYEVESVPTELASHCHVGGPPTRGHPFQHYAKRADMVAVVTGAGSWEGTDGTSIEVLPGVAVFDGALRAGGLIVPLVAGTPTGEAYRTSARYPPPPPGLWLHPDADGVLGHTELGPVRGPAMPVAGARGVRDPRVAVQTPCMRIWLVAEGDRISTEP